jgi:hypothetical protein
MTKKWNLQDIRPATPKRAKKSTHYQQSTPEGRSPSSQPLTEREHIPSIIIDDGTKKGNGRLFISIALFVVIVGSALGLSALVGKTELTIYPEMRELNVNAEFTAYPDKREASLSYEIMTLETVGESQVKATGQIQVEQQATGLIEIVKTTTGAERLIKNTRFRTPEGLVYRIRESVVVPGSVEDSSGSSIPGTIQIEVFADESGEEFNIDANKSFDIPGFEESNLNELYNAITARNPEAFTGGYSGPQFQIDENELSTSRQALQIKLRDDLLMRIDTEKPADFIAFSDAVAITYIQLPAIEYEQDLVTIREQAVLQIPLFKSGEFASFLAKQTVATYEGNDVRIQNPELLSFSYIFATTSSSIIANEPALSFNLTGKPVFIWEYDGEKLAQDLAGLPKTAINNAVESYPGIDAARVHITPFWKGTFPVDAADINVIEELTQIEK